MALIDHTREQANAPALSDPYRCWVAVIGMGASGSNFFATALNRVITHGLSGDVGFILADARPVSEFGRGIAWSSSQFEGFRANMRLHTIGFKQPLLDRICKAAGLEGLDDPKRLPEDFLFHQRTMIGDCLHQEFQEARTLAEKNGIPLHIESASVQDISRYHRGYSVHYTPEGRRPLQRFADVVVLALGNVPNHPLNDALRGCDNYIYNPWDWDNYKSIQPNSKVAVIGLGPTAIDAILMLADRGVKSIVAYSRTGRMQYPRPHNVPHNLSMVSQAQLESFLEIKKNRGKPGLEYEELYTLLTYEFGSAGACPEWTKARDQSINLSPCDALLKGMVQASKDSKWYSILKALDPITPFIWNAMTEKCRKQYMEELRADHTNLSFGMASGHANRLVNLFQNKQLDVRGGIKQIEHKGGSFIVTNADKAGSINSDEFDVIVNCTGIGSDLRNSNSPLINSLRDKGWLVPHPDGGARVDFDSGQLLDGNGARRGEIYSLVGSLTYGTHLLTHCLWQVWQSGERTAQSILGMLALRLPRPE